MCLASGHRQNKVAGLGTVRKFAPVEWGWSIYLTSSIGPLHPKERMNTLDDALRRSAIIRGLFHE